MRTGKGTRKITDWENVPGNAVTCHNCGKMLQRSIQTNSVIYCPRCGFDNFTYLEDNMKVQFSAKLLEAENAEKYIKTMVTAMQMLRRSPIRDYDYIPEDEPV